MNLWHEEEGEEGEGYDHDNGSRFVSIDLYEQTEWHWSIILWHTYRGQSLYLLQ